MSEGLKRFLGSTIRTVEIVKRQVEVEREREEGLLEEQKNIRRTENREKSQVEDIQRRKREASHKKAESALMIFLSQRQNVYDSLDKLKSGLYAQISTNPVLEKMLIQGWQGQGHNVSSLSEVFALGEKIQLDLLKDSIAEDLKLDNMTRQRFFFMTQGYKVERGESITDLMWSMNRPTQGAPPEDLKGNLLVNIVDQVEKIGTSNQENLINLMYSTLPVTAPAQEQPNIQTIKEILLAINMQPS